MPWKGQGNFRQSNQRWRSWVTTGSGGGSRHGEGEPSSGPADFKTSISMRRFPKSSWKLRTRGWRLGSHGTELINKAKDKVQGRQHPGQCV